LQHSSPSLHVFIPHAALRGVLGGLSQGIWEHDAPGCVQMPQVTLQQTSSTLQVFGPQ
jgi:hypothetical protein